MWIALYENVRNGTYFDGLGVGHIPKRIRKFRKNNYIILNTYRMKAYDSIMFCIGFINFIVNGKMLLRVYKFDQANDQKTLKYF